MARSPASTKPEEASGTTTTAATWAGIATSDAREAAEQPGEQRQHDEVRHQHDARRERQGHDEPDEHRLGGQREQRRAPGGVGDVRRHRTDDADRDHGLDRLRVPGHHAETEDRRQAEDPAGDGDLLALAQFSDPPPPKTPMMPMTAGPMTATNRRRQDEQHQRDHDLDGDLLRGLLRLLAALDAHLAGLHAQHLADGDAEGVRLHHRGAEAAQVGQVAALAHARAARWTGRGRSASPGARGRTRWPAGRRCCAPPGRARSRSRGPPRPRSSAGPGRPEGRAASWRCGRSPSGTGTGSVRSSRRPRR